MRIYLHAFAVFDIDSPDLHDAVLEEMCLRMRLLVKYSLVADAHHIILTDVGGEKCHTGPSSDTKQSEGLRKKRSTYQHSGEKRRDHCLIVRRHKLRFPHIDAP